MEGLDFTLQDGSEEEVALWFLVHWEVDFVALNVELSLPK